MEPRVKQSHPAMRGGDREQFDDGERYAHGRRAALVSIVGNTFLAGAKFALGYLTNSIALMADAAHSASDMGTSIVVWIGMRAARQPADARHPFGHGRAETVAALVVAVLLGVAGIDIAWTSVERMFDPPEIGGNVGGTGLLIVAGVVLATAAGKAWMGFYVARVGGRIENPSLLVDAWHHWSDALSSVPVAAALVLARWGIFGADPWLGMGVSLVVFYTAWTHLRKASSSLLGERPDREMLSQIESLARGVHGTKDVHEVAVHDYGRRKVASLHVGLEGGLSVEEAHRVASEVESELGRKMNLTALVHVEPHDERLPRERLEAIRAGVGRLLVEHDGVVSYHALTVQVEDHGLEVEFHVHVPRGTAIEKAHALEHELADKLRRQYKDLHIHVHVEPCPEETSSGHESGGTATDV